MLYAYELGMLTDNDALALEHHLYECNHCFRNAEEFKQAALLLRRSPVIRSEIANEARSSGKSRLVRLLLVAAAVFILAVPVYKFGIQERPSDVRQVLYLAPVRDNTHSVISLDQGGIAEIRFVLEGAGESDTHRVTIETRRGSVLYSDEDFLGFNEYGQGVITLPVVEFEKGYYSLKITDIENNDTLTLAEYPFRVK